MYAIVKTGGKQYTVKPGDVIAVEKLSAEIGDEIELPVIFVADGESIEADPTKAASTKVIAEVLDQFKNKKQLVFKFKKRKGYKKLHGHRQQLTRVRIIQVGSEKWIKPAKKVKVEEPDVEAIEAETLKDETPKVQVPKVEIPKDEEPEIEDAEVDTSKNDDSEVGESETEVPKAEESKTDNESAEKTNNSSSE